MVTPPWAARPDQGVRAFLTFEQSGIDRCRERRIVQGHGHIGASGPADFLPRRADVVAGRVKAEVGGAFVLALVIDGQGVQRAGEAVFSLRRRCRC